MKTRLTQSSWSNCICNIKVYSSSLTSMCKRSLILKLLRQTYLGIERSHELRAKGVVNLVALDDVSIFNNYAYSDWLMGRMWSLSEIDSIKLCRDYSNGGGLNIFENLFLSIREY